MKVKRDTKSETSGLRILYCASTSQGKLREFQAATQQLGYAECSIRVLPDFAQMPSPEETGTSFEQNAILKAEYYSKYSQGLVFADDSGLEVTALGGEPGIHSARFSGDGATDAGNNGLLLERLGSSIDRSARFVCVLALAKQGQAVQSFKGTVEGWILEKPRGQNGFGYDPLFLYPPMQCSLAELTPQQKILVSHRGRALASLLQFLYA